MGILLTRKVKKTVLVGLSPEWVDEERLGAWGEKVGAFRREGKSRRTNANGTSRRFGFGFLTGNADPALAFSPLAAKRVYDLAKSLAIPTVEVTAWPLPESSPPARNITSLSPPTTVPERAAKL